MRTYFLLAGFLLFLWACQTPTSTNTNAGAEQIENPPAEGFDRQGSDPEAIALADEVMKAMGGRAAWDATRFIEWNFFGARKLTWDKWNHLVRIEIPRDSTILLCNYETLVGKAQVKGEAITQPDSLAKLMEQARSIWINDSYWLVMPFKLKDSGVTLSYIGEDSTQAGAAADVVQLVFTEVGNTPQNKYEVWINKTDKLVSQWAYYPTATTEEPRFITPWGDYQQHGKVLIGGDRGDRDMMDIQVYDSLAEAVFTAF